jgi:hypothetical protein
MLSESGEKTCNPRSTGRTLSWLHALFRWVGVDMSFKSFMGFDDFHVNNSVARKGKFQFLSKQKLVYTGNRYTECPSFDLETLINITADLIPSDETTWLVAKIGGSHSLLLRDMIIFRNCKVL